MIYSLTKIDHFCLPFFLLFGALFFSCKKKELVPPADVRQYLHLSHTRTNTNPQVVDGVDTINYNEYDMRWLGGDLAANSSGDTLTMDHLDFLFDLDNPNTLWALGNHDYSNPSLVEHYTGRPSYYAHSKNGVCVLVLDTQDDASNIIGGQLVLLQQVADTISACSHLVLLTHKLIWMYGHDELEPLVSEVSNADIGSCDYCLNPNNFYTDVYPILKTLESKGIEVLCIAGDIGSRALSFEYETAEGVTFLASGIKPNEPENKALLFTHNLHEGSISWEFRRLSEL